jgi:hypothetical protein
MSPDRYHPRDHLVEPQPSEQTISGGYFSIADVFSVLSPTHWARESIKNLTGFDIFGEIGEFFVGDWEAFSKAGVAIGHVADALPEIGNNLYFGAEAMHENWTGNAGDSAWAYFATLGTTTIDQQQTLRHAAKQYESTAKGVWALAEDVSSLIEFAIDSFVVAAAAAAIGTALIETGVGAVAGYGVAALEIANGLEKLASAMLKIQTAVTVIEPAFQLIKAGERQLGAMNVPEIDNYEPPAGLLA